MTVLLSSLLGAYAAHTPDATARFDSSIQLETNMKTEISSLGGGTDAEVRPIGNPDLSSVLARLLARLDHDQYDEAQCSAPGGVELVGEERAFDEGYRRGHNAAKRDVIELIERLRCEAADQQPVVTGLRELRDAAVATPRVVLQRHWLAEHSQHEGEGG